MRLAVRVATHVGRSTAQPGANPKNMRSCAECFAASYFLQPKTKWSGAEETALISGVKRYAYAWQRAILHAQRVKSEACFAHIR